MMMMPAAACCSQPRLLATLPKVPSAACRSCTACCSCRGGGPARCMDGGGAGAADGGEEEGVCGERGWSARTMRKAVCGAVSAAAVMWSVPGWVPDMAVAEAANTPYSQSQSDRLQIGLLNGRIRACPLDINPNCVSTSSSNQAYAFPWEVPSSSSTTAVKKIESAILTTQKNAQIVKLDDVSDGKRAGKYLVAEVDGFLGRDTLEFLVRDDVVTYRSMANKVQYVYPFTTPIGDFGAQQKHIKALEDELGWALPDFDTTK